MTVPLVVVVVKPVVVVVVRLVLEAVKIVAYLVSVTEKTWPMIVIDLNGLIVKRPILLPLLSLK